MWERLLRRRPDWEAAMTAADRASTAARRDGPDDGDRLDAVEAAQVDLRALLSPLLDVVVGDPLRRPRGRP